MTEQNAKYRKEAPAFHRTVGSTKRWSQWTDGTQAHIRTYFLIVHRLENKNNMGIKHTYISIQIINNKVEYSLKINKIHT